MSNPKKIIKEHLVLSLSFFLMLAAGRGETRTAGSDTLDSTICVCVCVCVCVILLKNGQNCDIEGKHSKCEFF